MSESYFGMDPAIYSQQVFHYSNPFIWGTKAFKISKYIKVPDLWWRYLLGFIWLFTKFMLFFFMYSCIGWPQGFITHGKWWLHNFPQRNFHWKIVVNGTNNQCTQFTLIHELITRTRFLCCKQISINKFLTNQVVLSSEICLLWNKN